MKLETAVVHFGSRRQLAEALGITAQSTYAWGETVPKGRAYELAAITNGALSVDLDDYAAPDPRSEEARRLRDSGDSGGAA